MKTGTNYVMVELDEENDHIITKEGVKLYIDNTFEPEKHAVVTGKIVSIPDRLTFRPNSTELMPWETTIEVKEGDKVVMYYLGVVNALKKEIKKYFIKDGKYFVFIKYNNIFVVIRDKQIIPVNGYILVEPVDDPGKKQQEENVKSRSGIEIVKVTDQRNNTDVVYGKAVYIGNKNSRYHNPDITDENFSVSPGDVLVLKKVRDIPVEYEYHAKLDGGRKLYRIQRHDILAVL